MEKDSIQQFLEEEKKLLNHIEEIDKFQKERGEIEYRYITKGIADSYAYYQICGETPRKYLLQWVFGDSPYYDWGVEVKLPKKVVEKMIQNRDNIYDFIKERK